MQNNPQPEAAERLKIVVIDLARPPVTPDEIKNMVEKAVEDFAQSIRRKENRRGKGWRGRH